jgi:hypothetical protein
MTTFKEDFPHMHAALKAAESVQPGNELQEAASAAIIGLAFELEVRSAFPERYQQPQAEAQETPNK